MNYPFYQNYYPQQMAQQINQQMPQQIQNGGFVSVRSIAEAQNYPVAHGNSITFKDESAPYVYVKTMGFSQLDRPTFEVFRLVKEEVAQEESLDTPEIDKVRQDLNKLQEEVDRLKGLIETEVEADG